MSTDVKILGPNVAGAWNLTLVTDGVLIVAASLSNAQLIVLKAAITGHLAKHG